MNRPTLRTVTRWGTGLLVVMHGLIQLLGAVEGFGWIDVEQLTQEISTAMGFAWLVAAVSTVAAGVMLLARVHRWWWVGAGAFVMSQLLVVGAWSDAKAGTIANVVLLVAVLHASASQGAASARSHFRAHAAAALAVPTNDRIVTEADLGYLPAPVAEYLRRTGSVGQRQVTNFHAHIHGRIRAGSDKPWMTFVGEQVNTYGARPSRLFFMDATMFGLPVDVLHEFVDDAATMRVKVCSLFTMVDASGPELTRAETVTVFNDLCVLAPAAIIDAPIIWTTIDDHRVRGTYTLGDVTVSAELVFDDDHDLIDFVSQDRLAASPDGRTFTPLGWSTPITRYLDVGARRVVTFGEGRWHPDDGVFTYLEFNLDHISYNTSGLEDPARPAIVDADLRERVNARIAKTHGPQRRGHVPHPDGNPYHRCKLARPDPPAARHPVGAPRSPWYRHTMASEDGPRESIDLESLYLGDMARHARTATFASNWKSVLAVDASIGIVVLLIGLAVVVWAGWAGWILAVAGAIYVGLVGRRFLQWRWIRSQAGLG